MRGNHGMSGSQCSFHPGDDDIVESICRSHFERNSGNQVEQPGSSDLDGNIDRGFPESGNGRDPLFNLVSL